MEQELAENKTDCKECFDFDGVNEDSPVNETHRRGGGGKKPSDSIERHHTDAGACTILLQDEAVVSLSVLHRESQTWNNVPPLNVRRLRETLKSRQP
ncbi:unnamed protein product [Phytophthora fragariaefolia]|uniref:Unnamed protein product n=1 Tax=Phytophthora fragariaefolia TaxID=1490495 RepID=A0A9W6U299_9STRA|nr:unnamed protein product [Phytophthora fragariaefolia]